MRSTSSIILAATALFFFCAIPPLSAAENTVVYRVVKKQTVRLTADAQTLQIKERLPRNDFEDISFTNLLCSPNYNAMIKDPDRNPIAVFYFSGVAPDSTVSILMRYTAALKNKPVPLDASQVIPLNADELAGKQAYLGDQGDIRITERIRTTSKTIVRDQTNPYLKAKAIYDYITANVAYKDIAGISGTQTPEEVLTIRKGTCGDIAKLYVALARAAGIPAKPVAGQVFMPNVSPTKSLLDKGHAWAEIYIHGYGWQAVDPTFGIGAQDRNNYFCFNNTTHIKEAYGQVYSRMVGSLYSGSSVEIRSINAGNTFPATITEHYEIERLPSK